MMRICLWKVQETMMKTMEVFGDSLNDHGTKDEYSKALRAYQSYLGEIKSDQRDEAAAYDEEFKYY